MLTKLFNPAPTEPRTDGANPPDAVPATSDAVASGQPEKKDEVDSAPSKMDQATELYRRLIRKKDITRKDIVTAFIAEVGLTEAGAATYYQIIKKRRQ